MPELVENTNYEHYEKFRAKIKVEERTAREKSGIMNGSSSTVVREKLAGI